MRRPTKLAPLALLLLWSTAAPRLDAAPKELPPEATLVDAQRALDGGDPDGALRLLAPLLKKDSRNARALLLRSTAECMLGDLEPCRKDLDRALDLDPKLRQGWLNLSAFAIADGKWDDALAALAKAEALDPAAPDNAVNQGAVLLQKGDLEGATAKFARLLERQPPSAEAHYLVATNYAAAGYAALAIEHLSRAIGLDERTRVRARADANFAELVDNRSFRALLDQERWTPPAGTATAEQVFRTRFTGSESPIILAILDSLQLSGAPLESNVEFGPDWALFWAQFRIKVSRNPDGSTTVRLHSRPEHYFPPTWTDSTSEFFRDVETRLLRLELSVERGRETPP